MLYFFFWRQKINTKDLLIFQFAKKKIIKENKQLQVNKFLSKTHNIKVAKREFNLFYGSPYKTSDKLKKMLARPNLPHS